MFLFRKKKKAQSRPISKPVQVTRPVSKPLFDGNADPLAGEAPKIDPSRKRRRPAAGKTRLMGFDTSDGRVVDLFNEDNTAKDSPRMTFPVGIVMVTKGPGLGEAFALQAGMSQIGRGEDQAVRLDFGDMAISRSNHAAIVYDAKEHSFLLGHGGKSNVVRLNGKPVVTTSDLKNGDEIEIGETKMRFVAICSGEFNWDNTETEEGSNDDDMEIA